MITTLKFDLSISRTDQERIDMVLADDCPHEVLHSVANYDTVRSVIMAVACNHGITQPIIDTILSRVDISATELAEYVEAYNTETAMQKLSKTFCPIPWNHVSTNPEGTVRACCQILDTSAYGTGNIIKDDGTILSSSDNIDDHRNSALWKDLRRQFIKGEKPDMCKLCWSDEHAGGGSHRQRVVRMFPGVPERALAGTLPDGTICPSDFPIEYWDLRFGNNCNLKCRTCSPVSSNKWYDDYVSLSNEETLISNHSPYIRIEKNANNKSIILDSYNWYDDSVLWSRIVSSLPDAKRFYFTGGEPTINIKHKELLTIIIDMGLSKNISLDYNTNVAGIPKDMFALWSNFKSVNLGMSVDGIFEHFDYIRHPGKWSAAARTLEKIDTDVTLSNTNASLSVTVSVLNVLHLLDMQWWSIEQKWQRVDPVLSMHHLHSPSIYNIQNLPSEMKFYITKRYERFIADIVRCHPGDYGVVNSIRQNFGSVINHMNLHNENNQWDEFVKFTDRLDKIRNEDWKVSLSELIKMEEYYTATRVLPPVFKIQVSNPS